ncbi:hypothetical protein BASA61_008790 [Batrachochytrium salamandrivorans]|nr:hypothetical protein BASA61_008790 [Batrachochytrium salamandrivorans]KAH9270274.1 hypothetical protein BASA83_007613 [Batrachochytrium salamandrivorans]KAJ1336487.1 hypothetical protein BSLG_007271 [Batrachochytrium salamandrivorans]
MASANTATSNGTTPLTILARLSSGDKVPVLILHPDSTTVLDLKELVATAISSHPSAIRLVLRGRILKDNDKLISDYAVADKDVVHVARTDNYAASTETASPSSASSSNSTSAGYGRHQQSSMGSLTATPGHSSVPPLSSNTAPTSGITGPALAAGLSSQSSASPFDGGDEMAAIMNNPMMQAIFENPEFLQTMMQVDPRMRALTEENPELRAALSDPSTLREIGRGMRNPRLMQEMMRNQDRALSNIEAIPGGFNHLTSMYRQLQEPMNAGRTPDPSTDEANRHMANILGATSTTRATGPNSQALPNPWGIRPGGAASQGVPTFPGVHAAGNSFGAFGAPVLPSNRNTTHAFDAGSRTLPFMPFPAMTEGTPSSTSQATVDPATILPHQLHMFQRIAQINQGANPPYPNNPGMPANPTNTTPAMNPFLGLFGSPLAAPAPAPARSTQASSQESVEARYREQLASLRDMGFADEEKNRRAILAAGGNTDAAISYLLDM